MAHVSNSGIDLRKLALGVVALTLLWALFGPKEVTQVGYFEYWTFVEAFLFAGVTLHACQQVSRRSWIIVPIAAGAANFGLNISWLAPGILDAYFSLSPRLCDLAAVTVYSIVGALIFTGILHSLARPSYVATRTYSMAAVLCAFAGLPMTFSAFVPEKVLLVTHKSMWWTLFSLAFWMSSRSEPQRSAGIAS